jgi:hypothetical protein
MTPILMNCFVATLARGLYQTNNYMEEYKPYVYVKDDLDELKQRVLKELNKAGH